MSSSHHPSTGLPFCCLPSILYFFSWRYSSPSPSPSTLFASALNVSNSDLPGQHYWRGSLQKLSSKPGLVTLQ
eukprot:746976-Hanusia_phi.AAC.4